MFGIRHETYLNLRQIFAQYDGISAVIIYGSRAKGDYRTGSDIDLTLKGDGLDSALINDIKDKIASLYLPYMFDISIFSTLDSASFIAEINQHGKIFYQKQTAHPTYWEVKRLGEVCEEIFAGGDVPKQNLSKSKNGMYKIPIFSNGEKNKGLYGFTDIARVVKPSITISARGTIGYSAIREEPFYPAIRLITVTPNTDLLDLYFLGYALKNIDFLHSGTSIPQLTVPMIKKYQIPIPPLDEQKQIVEKLDALQAQTKQLEALYQQKLDRLKILKQSLLQQAFTGALTREFSQ